MIGMKVVLVMGMFALPVAALIILIVCIVQDARSHREMKRFKTAIRRCENVHGWDFTNRLLIRCSESKLPVKNRIELLEHFTRINTSNNREV